VIAKSVATFASGVSSDCDLRSDDDHEEHVKGTTLMRNHDRERVHGRRIETPANGGYGCESGFVANG
jgi:hypothetical protein